MAYFLPGARRMSARAALSGKVFLLAALVAACGGSPAKKAEKATATLRSWTSAGRMTAESWASGRVPSSYASKTLEIAGQELQTAARSLDEQSAAAAREEAASAGGLAQASRGARAAGAHLAAARAEVERGNRTGAAGAGRLLAGDAAALAVADSTLKATSP